MLKLIGRVCARGLAHALVLVQECRHVVWYIHCLWHKPCGLVWPMFVAQRGVGGTWCQGHEVRDSKNVQVRHGLGEELMGHKKLLLSKGVSLIRGEVG